MAGPRGYNSYRGGKGSKIKILAGVVLALVILGAVGVIRLQKYIVYDDSGRPRLELPKAADGANGADGANSAASSSAAKSGGDELIVQAPERTKIRGIVLPNGALTDWTSVKMSLLLSAVNYNAVVYTVKDKDGGVYYDSKAAPGSAIKSEPGTAAAIAAMTGSDYYTIARLSCFRDAAAAADDLEGKGLKNTGGYIFYDGNAERWLDPAKPAARAYLIDLIKECAAMGFDEVLLTDLSYPTVGKLDKIDYGGAEKSAAMEAFLTELNEALDGMDLKVGAAMSQGAVLSGTDAAAGQALSVIAPLVDGIYCPVSDAAQIAPLSAAVAAADGKTAFIPEWMDTPRSKEYLYFLAAWPSAPAVEPPAVEPPAAEPDQQPPGAEPVAPPVVS